VSLAKLVIFVGIGLAPLKQQSIFGHKVIPLSQRMLLAKQWQKVKGNSCYKNKVAPN